MYLKKMREEVCTYSKHDDVSVNVIFDLPKFYFPEKRVVLYGAGGMSQHYVDILNEMNIPIGCFCDSDSEKLGTIRCGSTVISPEFLDKETDLVCVSTSTRFHDEIYKLLLKKGFMDSQIFIYSLEKQYFSSSLFSTLPNRDEVYVDVGCLDGTTIKDFIKFCDGKYKKIYGFEPDSVSFERTKKFVEDEGIANVELHKKGAWSNTCLLQFNNLSTGHSNIADNGKTSIECITIDSIVKDEVVTFIKMDIEGAELEALKGAANTIIKNKPKLAISIYHKPEDILDIPLFLMGLVPEYRFSIKHHEICYTETVLYAEV